MMKNLGFLLFSAIFFGLSLLPPFNFLAFFSLVPLFLIFRKISSFKKAIFWGGVFGFLSFAIFFFPLLSLSVFGWSTFESLWQKKIFLFSIWFLISLLGGGIFWALLFSFSFYSKKKRIWFWLLFPFLFVSLEFLRAKIFLGYSWGVFGYSLASFFPFNLWAAYAGLYGLSFFLVLINILFYLFFFEFSNLKKGNLIFPFFLLSFLFFLFTSLSFVYSQKLERKKEFKKDQIKVAILQGAIGIKEFGQAFLSPDYKEEFKIYLKMLEDAKEAKVAVLPESILPSSEFKGKKEEEIKKELSNFLKEIGKGKSLIGGIDLKINNYHHNQIFFFNGKRIVGFYTKTHLVPFSEYNPLPRFLKISFTRFPYIQGKELKVFNLEGINFGGLICSEITFPSLLRKVVLKGGELIVFLGNESPFSNFLIREYGLAQTRIRAIEAGRFVLKSTKAGISAIISPSGEVLEKAKEKAKKILLKEVYPLKEKNIFVRFGQWFVYLSFLVSFLGFFFKKFFV